MNRITKVRSVITLTTDFGLSDGFVGMMKGVILSINPQAAIVDITHDIAPQDIEQGAFLFANAYTYFPANTIHVVVVDPGVGSARRPIGIQVGETIFVAPDNGVLTQAVGNCQLSIANLEIQAVHLDKSEFWLPHVSNTFHGRDVFAPVAAHLSLGVSLETMGEPIDDWVRLSRGVSASRLGDEIAGRVVHIDRYGNIITNIGEDMLAGMDRTRIVVRIGGWTLRGIKPTYAAAARGEAIALISSSSHVEIAVRGGDATQRLGIRIGDEVILGLDKR